MRYLRAVYQLANTLKEHLCKRNSSLCSCHWHGAAPNSTTVLFASLLHHTSWHSQRSTVLPNTCPRVNRSPTTRMSACTDCRRAGATLHYKSRRVLPLHVDNVYMHVDNVYNKQTLRARQA